MDALDLLEAGRYEEAVAAYRGELAVDSDDIAAIAGLARSLQASGAHAEALPLFERVDAFERAQTKGHPGRAKDIACVLWCLGERARAMQIICTMMDGVRTGAIKFGDQAGGASQGMLLHYMAVSVSNRHLAEEALSYLRAVLKGARFGEWPSSIARHLLGELSVEAVLKADLGQESVEQALLAANRNVLTTRRLCVILFHAGVKNRAEGDETKCMSRMRECAALKNPLVEPEWFLARCELTSNT